MPIDEISILGKQLSTIANNQDVISQNITADDEETQLQVPINQKIKMTGNITLSSLTYATDAFILDHPVQGYLGASNTLVPVVSYYNLEGNVTDSNSIINGITTGSYTSGKINQGINLTSTQNIILGTANQYTSSAISVAFWYKITYDASIPVENIFTLGNVTLGWQSMSSWGLKIASTSSLFSVNPGVWYFAEIFATEGGTNGYIKINGTKYTNAGSASLLTNSIIFTKYDLGCTIDEVYVNDAALTDDEYNTLYNSGSGVLPESIGYKLDEGYQGAAPKFPLTFPIKFITPDKTILYTYNY